MPWILWESYGPSNSTRSALWHVELCSSWLLRASHHQGILEEVAVKLKIDLFSEVETWNEMRLSLIILSLLFVIIFVSEYLYLCVYCFDISCSLISKNAVSCDLSSLMFILECHSLSTTSEKLWTPIPNKLEIRALTMHVCHPPYLLRLKRLGPIWLPLSRQLGTLRPLKGRIKRGGYS